MSKYKDGELICLHWEDYPGYQVIRGHVGLEEAAEAVASEYGERAKSCVTDTEHKYGFWGFGQDECGEPWRVLYERDQRGRGRFPITLARTNTDPTRFW